MYRLDNITVVVHIENDNVNDDYLVVAVSQKEGW